MSIISMASRLSRGRDWRRMLVIAGASAVSLFSITAPAAAGGALTPEQVAAIKAATDTDPHTPLTKAQVALLAQKQAEALAYVKRKFANMPSAVQPFTSGGINLVQQAQQTTYWCGPATVSELVDWKGHSTSQSTAATLLKTTTDGTAWSGVNAAVPNPTGRPVPDVLNYRIGVTYYIPVDLPGSPTSSNVSTYKNYLVFDIDNAWGLAGNAWEVAGGPHLTGHPVSQTIFHYYAIFGYDYSGSGTDYADSVAGSSISWAGSVPKYTINFSSTTLTTINGGRGYVW